MKCLVAVVLTTAYVALSFAAAVSVPVSAAAAAPGKLYLSPATISVGQGSTVAVQVRLDTGGDVMNAVQANFSYPANLLEYSSIASDGSAFGIAAPSGGTGGTVNIARADFNGAKGDVLVATVNFKAIGLGSGKLDFTTGSEAYRSGDSTNAVGSNAGATLTVAATGSSVSPPPSAAPSATPGATPPSITDTTTTSNLPSSADLSALPDDGVSNTVQIDNSDATASKSGSVIWPIFVVLILVAGGVAAAIFLQRRQQLGYEGYADEGYDLPIQGQSYADANYQPATATPPAAASTPALPTPSVTSPADAGQSGAPQSYANSFVASASPVAPTSWQPTLSSIPAPAITPHVPGAQPADASMTSVATPSSAAQGPIVAESTVVSATPFGPPAAQAPSSVVNPGNNQLPS